MSTNVLEQWPEWRDKLIYELRMENVTGPEIGAILAEVEAHLQTSGEQADESFGDPAEYARNRARDSRRVPKLGPTLPDSPQWLMRGWGGTSVLELAMMLACFVGSIIVGTSASALAAGNDSIGFLPAWVALILGLVLAGGPLALLPDDRIIDPRSGMAASLGGPTFRGLPLVIYVVPLLLSVVMGWFSNP